MYTSGSTCSGVPYSGKLLLVYNIMELLVSTLEIFVVLIFTGRLRSPCTHTILCTCMYSVCACYDITISPPIQKFAIIIFVAADLLRKCEICTMRKFPTVRHLHVPTPIIFGIAKDSLSPQM